MVERLAARQGCSFKRKLRFAAEVAEFATAAGKVVLIKPQTFMNRSGAAVAALTQWTKIAPAEMLVIVDDADLPVGEIRLRECGGSGGHNGLRSIIEALGGSEGFGRLRIGIGGGGRGADIADHVLSRFEKAEQVVVEQMLAVAVDAVECTLANGLPVAMNQFNRKKKKSAEGEMH